LSSPRLQTANALLESNVEHKSAKNSIRFGIWSSKMCFAANYRRFGSQYSLASLIKSAFSKQANRCHDLGGTTALKRKEGPRRGEGLDGEREWHQCQGALS
jgi:hypothetical protein